MSLYLDHIFIITEPDAKVANLLANIGLVEGTANVHPGQGTSNRRFFFTDFTIEFLFVSDAEEAAKGVGNGLGILTRSLDAEASPFGLIVRVSDSGAVPKFPNWQYYPEYFDGQMCFFVGKNSVELQEPLCICMPPMLPKRPDIPAEYQNPGWTLTDCEICIPAEQMSNVLQTFDAIENLHIITGKPHNMRITFNNGMAGRREDFTSALPLIVEW